MTVKLLPVVTIHGVSVGGDFDNIGYSAPLEAALREFAEASGLRDVMLTVHELLWADLAQSYATAAANRTGHGEILSEFTHLMGADYALDVLAYSQLGVKGKIQAHIRRALAKLPGPYVLALHSMGTVVGLDAYTDMIESDPGEAEKVAGILTFGSPLGIDLPSTADFVGYTDRSERLERMTSKGQLPATPWINLYDKQDVIVSGTLGEVKQDPLERFAGYQRLGVVDLEVNSGWYHDAHTSYWGNAMLAQQLLGLISP
jgi:hypothetical protein